jgi:hypothetical protein
MLRPTANLNRNANNGFARNNRARPMRTCD